MLTSIFVKTAKHQPAMIILSWKLSIQSKLPIKLLQLSMIKNTILSKLMVKEFNYLKFLSSITFLKHSADQDNQDHKTVDSHHSIEDIVHSLTNHKENLKKNKKKNRKKLKKFLNLKKKLKFKKRLNKNHSKRSQFSNNQNQLLNKRKLFHKKRSNNKSQLRIKELKNRNWCKAPTTFQEF